MRKLPLMFGLASLLFLGYSERNSRKNDLLEDIFKDRTFEIEKYNKYIFSRNNDSINSISYIAFDLDKNGKPDLIAATEIEGTYMRGDTLFLRTKPYAFLVGINKNEDEKYELFYEDFDDDNYLEARETDQSPWGLLF
jgi:hypothetical protein